MISASALRELEALQVCAKTTPIYRNCIDLLLPSAPNLREHHHAKAKRVAAQRNAVAWLLKMRPIVARYPLAVRLVRVAPRRLDDDNCVGAMKAFRDSVAEHLGVDDRDPRVTWLVDQESGPASVLIEVYALNRGEHQP
jgi:hypothetical protein